MKKMYKKFKFISLGLSAIFLSSAVLAQPAAPTGLTVTAYGTAEMQLRWGPAGDSSFVIQVSTDDLTYMSVDTVAKMDTLVIIGGLDAGIDPYYVQVFELSALGNGDTTSVSGKTTSPNLEVHFPLNDLDGDTAIVDAISGSRTKAMGTGQVTILDAGSSGLSMPAVHFGQASLPPLSVYVPITDIVAASEMAASLLERSISFWLKNDEPDRWAIPLSIAKRTGMTIAFKNDSIWAFTKQRVNAGTGNNFHAQGFGVPYTKGSGWAYINYVYHEPYTYLYINGKLAGSMKAADPVYPFAEGKSGWPFVGPWGSGGDKDYEIGALYNPCVANVVYLGGTYDANAIMQKFFGSMADLKFHNFALSPDSIQAMFDEMAADLNLKVTAKGPDRLALVWDTVPGANSYQILQDGAIIDTLKMQKGQYIAEGLTAETEYSFEINALGAGLASLGNTATASTLAMELMVHLPLDALVNDSIENIVDGTMDLKERGTITAVDAASTGLGVGALKFNSSELPPIVSYFKLYNTVDKFANQALLGRTVNFWLKMENDQTAVPFSFGKRRGGGILIENGKVHAMTGARVNGSNQWADSTGADYTPGDWSMITYQYDFPVTRVYVNGILADESDGLGYYAAADDRNWPTPLEDYWEANPYGSETGSSAQLGAQDDPFYPMVYYWRLPGWDPGYTSYIKWGLNGMMADMRMFNYAVSADDLKAMFDSVVVELNLKVTAKGPERLALVWDSVPGVTSYEILQDGSVIETLHIQAKQFIAEGLTAQTEYTFQVNPVGAGKAALKNMATATTLAEEMMVRLPLDELINDSIENIVDGTMDLKERGTITVVDGASTGLAPHIGGVGALRFTSTELPPIVSYFKLYNTVYDFANQALLGRTVNFWLKMENDQTAVPFSFGKRRGGGILIENGMVHAMTGARVNGSNQWADSTGADYTPGEWSMITYQYDFPVTRVFVNGVLADESDGLGYYAAADDRNWPTPLEDYWEANEYGNENGSSAQLGAQDDPFYPMVYYWRLPGWDPGYTSYIKWGLNGMMADMRMYNFALTADSIMNLYHEYMPPDAVRDVSAEKVQVYPNPASGVLYIKNAEGSDISIFNSVGQLVLSTRLYSGNQVDIAALDPGIYFLRVSKDKEISTVRFSIIK